MEGPHKINIRLGNFGNESAECYFVPEPELNDLFVFWQCSSSGNVLLGALSLYVLGNTGLLFAY